MARVKQTSKPKDSTGSKVKSKQKSKSSKKSVAVKKVHTNNIDGITKSAIKRLARQAGVLKIGCLVYEEAKAIITSKLTTIANSFVTLTDYKRKKTVDTKIMYASLPYNMYVSKIAGKVFKGLKKGTKKEGSTRKTSKGSVSLREVKHFQKQYGTFLMRKIPFVRLVKEISTQFRSSLRFTKQSLYLLQTYVEMCMVNLFESSAKMMLHASRITLSQKDLQLANELSNKEHLNHMSSEPINNLKPYIYKVLKKVHPNNQISSGAHSQINGVLNTLGMAYGNIAMFLTGSGLNSKKGNKRTIGSREIQTITKFLFPGELAKHAISEGTKAVTKFMSSDNTSPKSKSPKSDKKSSKKSRVRKGLKAGLQFSVSVCDKFLRFRDRHVSKTAPVYLAGVLEYLCAEILELTGNAAKDSKNVKISSRHLVLAVGNDQELSKLFNVLNVKIICGGYLPNPKLLEAQISEKKKAKKSKKKVAV